MIFEHLGKNATSHALHVGGYLFDDAITESVFLESLWRQKCPRLADRSLSLQGAIEQKLPWSRPLSPLVLANSRNREAKRLHLAVEGIAPHSHRRALRVVEPDAAHQGFDLLIT